MRGTIAVRVIILLSFLSVGEGAVPYPINRLFTTWNRIVSRSHQEEMLNPTKAFQEGPASWYGERFQGRITAIGESFDANELTAAHPTLPLGTYVKITSKQNGRAVVVRITDRGPFIDGRIIDVSQNTARILGFREQGVQAVRVDVLHLPSKPHRIRKKVSGRNSSGSKGVPQCSSLDRKENGDG
jgi:rare lipoprotein A (peptidoglycan hydrolase)